MFVIIMSLREKDKAMMLLLFGGHAIVIAIGILCYI